MSREFTCAFTVGAEAIDENGHVNNVSFVQWMQDVAISHSTAIGFTRELYSALTSSWVARSHFIKYLAPAFAGDGITITTWIDELSRSSAKRRYRFVRDADQRLLVEAETDWVYINAATGRPMAIHQELRDLFAGSLLTRTRTTPGR